MIKNYKNYYYKEKDLINVTSYVIIAYSQKLFYNYDSFIVKISNGLNGKFSVDCRDPRGTERVKRFMMRWRISKLLRNLRLDN